jgi:glycosyl transferase family 25
VPTPTSTPPAPVVTVEKPFEVLNRSFDRIWVVTLARAEARQARVRERLRGLDFSFHLGADKQDLDFAALRRDGVYDEALAREVSRRSRPMSPGQIGCALSHRQLYEETLREGHRRVLVFEDDVVPREADLPLVGEALAQLPASFDVAYLGWTNFERVTPRDRAKQAVYVVASAMRLMKWRPSQILRFHPRPYSPNLLRAGLHHCTHAYAFSAAGARKLLEAQTPVAHIADQLLIHMILSGKLEAYATVPKFFDQEAEPGGEASYVGRGVRRGG